MSSIGQRIEQQQNKKIAIKNQWVILVIVHLILRQEPLSTPETNYTRNSLFSGSVRHQRIIKPAP